jgi:L-seryl-tRNA(Ser) seleniumtransferase
MAIDSFVSSRRALLRQIEALPLFGYFAAQDLWGKAQKVAGRSASAEIYTRIGVTPIINARGTWTYITGSLELPEVKAAKQAAADHFVDMWELQKAVSKRLAELSGAEAGMVTAGAASAMGTATAGCMAGTDPAKIWQLPDHTGMKYEVIMFGGRISFDSAIRAAGGELVMAYSPEELQAKINEKTVMVYTTARGERLERGLAITKKAGVPMLVDWAAGIPPIENLGLPWKMGADLYTFSGGKGLCGPQCSGLLLGRKDLIEAALANSAPWEGAVCRAHKVGKEEIMGCLAAVETWKKMDLKKLDSGWTARVKRIVQLVETVPGVKAETTTPAGGNRYPTVSVIWDEAAFKMTVLECAKKLRDGSPRIEVLTPTNPSMVPGVHEGDPNAPRRAGSGAAPRLRIVSLTLQAGEELLVGRRLREVLLEARKQAQA